MVEKADVELDIFSGRPNPAWTLSQADATHILRTTASLPAAPPAQLATNLGYRGFIVVLRHGKEESRVVVQNGMVRTTTRDGTTTYHRDPDRALERWLLNTGRGSLGNDVFTLVERELGR